MSTLTEFLRPDRLVTIEPNVALADAQQRFEAEHVSHLLVVRGGELVGVLCVCDLDHAPRGASVAEAMSRRVWTADVSADAHEAAERMLEHGVSCLPVLRGGALCGVITLSDLARAGVASSATARCSACGSDDHVRCAVHGLSAGFCLECTRKSEPPEWNDDLGGSS
ncbi:MAG: CBS domain-containing protein [Polyangiales bacterium]